MAIAFYLCVSAIADLVVVRSLTRLFLSYLRYTTLTHPTATAIFDKIATLMADGKFMILLSLNLKERIC